MSETKKPSPRSAARQAIGPRPRLIEWLYRQAQKRGQTHYELAHEIGITHAELMMLAQGEAQIDELRGCSARLIAQYLGIAPAAVWLLAGKLTVDDFVMPDRFFGGGNVLLRGLYVISHDPVLGPLVPPDAFHGSRNVEALLCTLHQDASEQGLFPEQRVPLLLQGLQEAAAAMAKQDTRSDADDAGSVH